MDAAGKQVAVSPPNSTIHQYNTGDSTTVRMFTLASSDYVSTNIQHGYERNLTAAILQLLRDAAAAADAARPPLYVDLGANLGLHAVPVAAAGFNVLAFEAAPTNLALLRTTLCANQPLLSKVSLLATALGREAQNCSMHAWHGNKGNGYLFCDGRPVPEGYVHLGDASTRRLDDLLHTQVEVLKMDVEGFECECSQI
jgi:FkbM family methyltransferase